MVEDETISLQEGQQTGKTHSDSGFQNHDNSENLYPSQISFLSTTFALVGNQ